MDKLQIRQLKSIFDSIMRTTDDGIEFWLARELQEILGYASWQNFTKVIEKAESACRVSDNDVSNHFNDIIKIVAAGVSEKDIGDIALTRYACYLIAQNGDPRKKEIAFAQSYFALQTRKQELIEDRINLITRLEAREKLKESEKRLSQNIYERGVDDKGFGRIRSKGDMALFGGNDTGTMKIRLGIKENRPLADFLPTVTIAAKNLAAEMTNHNVEQNDLYGEPSITREHIQNNESVRDILEQRGIVPEELPPEEDIKKLERRVKSEEKKLIEKSVKHD